MPSKKITTSINPATGEIIGKTHENTVEELEQAVALAKIARHEWAKLSFQERAQYLFAIRDYIVENADKISDVISKDSGKTKMDALSTEVLSASMAITYYAKNAKKVLKRKRLSGGSILTINKRSYVDRVPMGVVGIISPWNYPFSIPFHEIAMALIAGNGVVLKVASQSLEVGKIIKECVEAGKLPKDIFHLINLPGKIAGDAFMNSGINKLFFTGSVPTGKYLMEKAAKHLIPLSLELGGNDAMIVCKDANLYRAAGGAIWAGLSNAGQSCAGVERIYIEAEVYDEFVELLKKKMSELKQGADVDSNVDIGSVTTKEQLKKIREHLKDAKKKGAKIFQANVFMDGQRKGLFCPPVILENISDDMMVVNEEIFGPILAVQKVENVEEAIAHANASTLGLTASVWTKNRRRGHEIASRLEVGSVMINDHLMSHGLAETPWGGWKESGIGRTHGYIGLEEMTQPRCVIDDILPGVQKNMWWYPHNKKVYEGLKGGLEFLYSKRIEKKLTGGLRLVQVFFRTFQK
ncbi:MAG: aldehyde dehydrogenase family protein [Bacteroidota bacterium]|jgi:succinate-semialdehyde dehydrogenase/glutarate-semialdehyde dehydrogenase